MSTPPPLEAPTPTRLRTNASEPTQPHGHGHGQLSTLPPAQQPEAPSRNVDLNTITDIEWDQQLTIKVEATGWLVVLLFLWMVMMKILGARIDIRLLDHEGGHDAAPAGVPGHYPV